MEISNSLPANRSIPSGKGAPGAKNRGTQDVAQLEDLFKGSRPKFGPAYEKFIASTQVPHSVAPSAYYDEDADKKLAETYYAAVANLTDPAERTSQLRSLVTQTHKPEPRGYHYVVAKSLYSDVDREPDGTVRSIYTQEPIKILQYPDVSLQTLSEQDISTIAGAAAVAPEVLGAWMCFKKGSASMNCEHVVPQSMFGEKEPMRSDLHHLFACDMLENNHRGDTPYGKFVPAGGKGEVARATLYFMLRYPSVKLPYGPTQVEMLKEWSAADPPDVRERHRNHQIQALHGNRNPFIDHPDWVKDFSLASGKPQRR